MMHPHDGSITQPIGAREGSLPFSVATRIGLRINSHQLTFVKFPRSPVLNEPTMHERS
jgi:hypothetical protein